MITNKLSLPQPFVDAATSNHEYKPNRYSVTEVLGGTCEAVLKRRHAGEGDEDVADRVWAILGTAVHKVLQEAEATESQLQENWLSVPVRGTSYELSGIFDLYDDATKTVTDWKTCSVWKVTFGDFEDWRKQTLMYCWMLRQLGIDASRGEIVAIMRDHSIRKAETERDYPKHPVFRIGWDFTGDDFMLAERDVSEWFREVAIQESIPDDELQPCNPEQRWHKPDKWAVRKKGRKTAVRVYESEKDARVRAMEENRKADSNDLYYVEYREGEDTRCQSYCSVAQFCPYWKGLQQS
jgi:hypothetical protein